VAEAIRERVVALLDQRPELTDVEFGRKIGRGYSWVSAFRAGTRHATDIDLLVTIAKYFGVTVGYLLGETGRTLDAGAMTLLATWDGLQHSPRDRRMLLDIAATFRRPTDESGEPPTPADPREAPRTNSGANSLRKTKRR